MIFGTVGTSHFDFTRMVKVLDDLSKEINEKVIIQIGHTEYIPKNADYVEYLSPDVFEKTIKKSRVVIISGGSGALFKCIDNDKKPVIFPRLKRLNEHIDDHQVFLAKECEKEGMSFAVNNLEELRDLLKSNKDFTIKYHRKNNLIYDKIKEFIEEVASEK